MTTSTKPFANRLAVVFDFDETLAADTFALLLQDLDLDPDTFKRERVQPLVDDGWDKYIARAYCLVEESNRRSPEDKITKARLEKVGQGINPFSGVSEMFPRLRQCAQDIVEDVEIEFYIISGGFVEMARQTSFANHFKAIWGCQFAFDEAGAIKFIKQQMTNTEKTSYLYYLSKGMDTEKEKDLMFAYSSLADDELYIPLTQIIYVGDGASDAPCFAVVNQSGGIGIGLYKQTQADKWSVREKINTNQRVDNIAPPDYGEHSELMQSITLAVEAICKQIALRRLGANE